MPTERKDTSGVDAVAYYAAEEILKAEKLETRPAFDRQDGSTKRARLSGLERMPSGF